MWLGDVTTDSGSANDATSATGSDSGGGGLLQQLLTGGGTLISDISQAALAKQQLSTASQVTALQLQRAQQGLPPLNIDPSTLGVPSVSVGLSPGVQQVLQYAVFGVLGIMALGLLAKARK